MPFNWFQAGLAGFVLIARRPVSFLAWFGLVALSLVPVGLVLALLGLAGVLRSEGAGAVAAVMPLIGFALTGAMILSAAVRAHSQPEERRLAYLRFGSAELRAVVVAVLSMLLYGGAYALSFYIGTLIEQPSWNDLTPSYVALSLVVVVVLSRLSLAWPAMVSHGLRKGFGEGWGLARGRWPHLAGMNLVTVAATLGAGLAFNAAAEWISDGTTPDSSEEVVVMFGLIAAVMLLYVLLIVVNTAPGAMVYGRLRDHTRPLAEVFD